MAEENSEKIDIQKWSGTWDDCLSYTHHQNRHLYVYVTYVCPGACVHELQLLLLKAFACHSFALCAPVLALSTRSRTSCHRHRHRPVVAHPVPSIYIPRYPPLNNFNWHIFNGGFLYACGWKQKKKKECRRRRTSRATIVVAQKTMWKWIANGLGEGEQRAA